MSTRPSDGPLEEALPPEKPGSASGSDLDALARAAIDDCGGGYALLQAVRRGGEVVDLEVLDANSFTCRLWARVLPELLGERLSEILQLQSSEVLELNAEALRTGQPVETDLTMQSPTGAVKRRVTVVPLGANLTANFTRDVSVEDRFRTLVTASGDLIAVVDDQAQLVYANQAGAGFLGLDASENVGRSMLELIHPDDHDAAATALLRDISEPGAHPPATYRFMSASGEWRSLELRATNCLDNPSIRGVVINAHDVTDRILADQQLKSSMALLSAVLDSTEDWIWSVDTESYAIVSYNRALYDFYLNRRGVAIEVGMRPEDLELDEARLQFWRRGFEETLKDGSFAAEYTTNLGATFQLTMNVLRHDGTAYGIVTVGKDLTRSKQAELRMSEALSLLDALQSSAPVGFAFLDRDFRFVRVNEKAAAVNGLPVEEHIGRTLAEINPNVWSQIEPEHRHVLTTGEPVLDQEVAATTAEDPERLHTWVESYYPVRVGGEIVGVGEVFVDITDRIEAEKAQRELTASLEASEERFRTLANFAPIGILEASQEALVTYANPKLAEIAGRDIESLLGRGWTESFHRDDTARLLDLIERVRNNPMAVSTQLRIRRPKGELKHVRLLGAATPNAGSYVATVEDITEEVLAREELAHYAFYDGLTGLPNRALFLDRLKEELARRTRAKADFAVLFLDVDRFKDVNDSLGHVAGDAVLKEAGARFRDSVRAGETVARFGGDEFAFIIRDLHDPRDAVRVAERVLKALESPIRWGTQHLVVTGSIGIVIPGAPATAETVLRDADAAMYKAKEAGRNRCELFDEELHYRLLARLEMESELRLALTDNELEVYYQPKVSPGTGKPYGAEALIRWNHPKRGLVPPLDFIPLAEDLGLIGPIGAWVFEQAVAQLAAWDAQEGGPNLEIISVNVSSKQLEDLQTSREVRAVVQKYGVAPNRIVLEVTESVVMADNAPSRSSLQVFKDVGLGVAIDDFGTGYSSLAYLHTLPVTTLKIDRSFIERLDGPTDSVQVVRAIVDMAHAMGLRVIAEGVSSERMAEVVTELGCDGAQGFFWAKPMPLSEFEGWWQAGARRS